MKYITYVSPFIMGAVNLPFYHNWFNMLAAGFCFGIGVTLIIYLLMDKYQ